MGLEGAFAVSSQAWTDSATGHKASLNEASASTSVLQKIEWKFDCRGDGCPRTLFSNSHGEDTGLRVREGVNMKNRMKLAMLVVAFAIYRSACTAVQREF